LARVTAMMGNFEEAAAKAQASFDLATRQQHPASKTYALFWIAFIQNLRGWHREAVETSRRAMEMARLCGLPQFVEWSRILLGSSLSATAQVELGIEEMRRSLDHQLAMHSLVERPYCLTLLA